MMNIYFPDEEITDNDLYFICYMTVRHSAWRESFIRRINMW